MTYLYVPYAYSSLLRDSGLYCTQMAHIYQRLFLQLVALCNLSFWGGILWVWCVCATYLYWLGSGCVLMWPVAFCFANPARSRALSKQRLSHLLIEATSLVYGTKCLSLPQGAGTHSTSGMATLWALFKGFPVSVLFVLQLADHHHTLLFGFIVGTLQPIQWLILCFLLALPCGTGPIPCIYVPCYMCCTKLIGWKETNSYAYNFGSLKEFGMAMSSYQTEEWLMTGGLCVGRATHIHPVIAYVIAGHLP